MWGRKSRLSASIKLLLFMVPLILVFGFIVLSGINGFNNYWTPSSSLFSSSSSGNQDTTKDFIGQRVAGGADNKQEALSDDYNVIDRSVSSPLSVQAAIPVQSPSVSLF